MAAGSRFQRFITNDISILAASLLLGLSLLPILILIFFSFPQTDDFYLAAAVRELGFLQFQVNTFMGWSGRYAATLLGSLHPLLAGNGILYALELLLLSALQFLGLYLVMTRISEALNLNRMKWLFTFGFIAVYCIGLSDISGAYFWLPGALAFQLPSTLLIFLGLVYTNILRQKGNLRLYVIPAFLLIIFIIGLNEIAMVVTLVMTGSIWTWDVFIGRRQEKVTFMLFLLAALASAVVIIAPGNSSRMEGAEFMPTLGSALADSFRASIHFVKEWLIRTPILPVSILILPWLLRAVESRKDNAIGTIHPAWVVTGSALTLFAGFFSSIYPLGAYPPPRAINLLWFIFMAGWFIFLWTGAVFLVKRYHVRARRLPIVLTIAMLMVISLQLYMPNPLLRAWKDLVSGKASCAKEEFQARVSAVRSNTNRTLILPPLSCQPKSLIRNDLTEDPGAWENRFFAVYFEKDSVIIGTASPGDGVPFSK